MPMPLLSLITFLPLAAIPFVILIPRALPGTVRNIALGFMLTTFLASLYLYFAFDAASAEFQFVEDMAWVGSAIHYKLGVDGISLLLVMLTTFLAPVAFLGAYGAITRKVKEFAVAMLVLETALLGTLLATDLFFFYVFWELMLIPMYLMIGVWGGTRRLHATVKFVIFSLAGSLIMFIAILYLYMKGGSTTFDYSVWVSTFTATGSAGALSVKEQVFLFIAFGLAFAVRIPLFPFHTWLPDALAEAPTPGSAILAGVVLKLGAYGFLRFAIPLFPEAAAMASAPLMGLAALGVVYGSLVAFAQDDLKKLLAYTGVAHLGLIMLGMFALTREGLLGSILHMVNHGLSASALFLCAGFLEERRRSRLLADFGGLAAVVPVFTVVFFIALLSSIGLPGTNGFVSEFLVLAGVFKEGVGSVLEPGIFTWRNFVLVVGVLACSGIVLGAACMLNMARKLLLGAVIR